MPPPMTLLLMLVLALRAAPDSLQTQGAAAQAPAGPNEQARAIILDLKRKADQAVAANNTTRAKELYLEILKYDPDDFLARQELSKIVDAEERKRREDQDKRIAEADTKAKSRAIQAWIDEAEQLVYEARATGTTAPLARAQERLNSASRQQPGSPDVARIQQLIDGERRAQSIRQYEVWGFGIALALVVLVPLVIYLWKPSHRLEMVEGPQPGQIFSLKNPTTRFGALASEVDFTIADPLRKVSRHHCDVVRHGRHYFIVDHSTNGTFVNGQPIPKAEPILLRRGDRLGLGGEITLLFR
jgi:hypothetical protein